MIGMPNTDQYKGWFITFQLLYHVCLGSGGEQIQVQKFICKRIDLNHLTIEVKYPFESEKIDVD